jgi:hypothetical protein
MTFFAFTKEMNDEGVDITPGVMQFDGTVIGYNDNATSLRVRGPNHATEGGIDVQSYSGIFYNDGYDVTGTLKTRFIIGANVEMDMELQAPHQLRLVANDNTQTDGQLWMASHTNIVLSPRGVDSVNCRRLIIDRVDKVNFDDSNTSDVEVSVSSGNLVLASVPVLPTYTVGTLPPVVAGGTIFVSDAAGLLLTGSMCFSNGAVWIDVTTGAAVTV